MYSYESFQCVPEVFSVGNNIYLSVFEQIFRCLKVSREFLPDCLFYNPLPAKTYPCALFGNNNITQCSKTCRYTAKSRLCKNCHIKDFFFVGSCNGTACFCHLHKIKQTFLLLAPPEEVIAIIGILLLIPSSMRRVTFLLLRSILPPI